jgi:hypothetical protein
VLSDLADSTRQKGGSFMNRKIFVLLALSIGVVIFGIGAAANPAPAEKPLFWPTSYTAIPTCNGVVVTNKTPLETLYKEGSKWYKLDSVTGEGTFPYNPGGQASGQLKYHWVMTNFPYSGHDETVVWHGDKPAECNPTATSTPLPTATSTPLVCPQGQHVEGDQCVDDPTPTEIVCPEGQHLEGDQCVDNPTPTEIVCPEGQHLEGDQCVDNPISTPEKTQTLVPTNPQPPSGGGGGGTSTGAGPNTSPWGAIALTMLGVAFILTLAFENKLVAIGKKAITQIRGK